MHSPLVIQGVREGPYRGTLAVMILLWPEHKKIGDRTNTALLIFFPELIAAAAAAQQAKSNTIGKLTAERLCEICMPINTFPKL